MTYRRVVTATMNILAKFGGVVFEIYERIDRQTDILIAIVDSRSGGGVITWWYWYSRVTIMS